jgi:hypothetical protein
MKKRNYLFIGIIIIIAIIAWYLISPVFNVVEINEESPLNEFTETTNPDFESEMEKMKDVIVIGEDEMPETPKVILEGEFIESAHEVSGKALVIETNENRILRFENFETVNGPNLHIYLSTDLTDDDFVDLGPIKATKGNVNYDIPENTDLDEYDTVLVWCVPFKVLFSFSEVK